VIYFEGPNGHVTLAAFETGKPGLARKQYEIIYKPQGFEWREANTLPQIRVLQERMIAQERLEASTIAEQRMSVYDLARKKTFDRLRQRMCSRDCSPFERDAIAIWLGAKDESGRKRVEQALLEHQSYMWVLEMNSKTKIEDRMKGPHSL